MHRSVPYCFFIYLLFHSVIMKAQDIHFSQFYEFPILRNPALAGIFSGNFRLSAAYRNQWQSVTVPYRTMGMSGECKLLRGFSTGDFITAGIQATNDVAGDSKLQRTQVLPVINYHKLLNEDKTSFISLAFMGGVVSQRFDASKLQFDDQYVNGAYSASNATRQQFGNTGLTYWDGSVGVSFKTSLSNNINMYIGGGVFHITEPRVAFTKEYDVRLNRKWGLNGGLSAWINDMDKIVFYADYFMQGGNRMIQCGGLYSHSFDEKGDEAALSIAVGGTFRWNDAFIPIIKLYTHQLGIGLSYDVNISKLTTASQFRGGFELSLSYIGLWQRLAESLEKVECPIKIW
ncbi:type IX secretion system membrane protein PorP/SprF [Niastella caeni]|uniref:Type IX secretion system membrane protein PorP/SprF n=1 Tax=Niastella caeni TaxID=2569763 RepID=A0A4S8HI38_9BACT|nr:PorP/SprF family type IX secretion system membrane protein [Niastella caeni]THU34767.1 type IX secretion system membrane protein PorP/SprF [Niastella caeni]